MSMGTLVLDSDSDRKSVRIEEPDEETREIGLPTGLLVVVSDPEVKLEDFTRICRVCSCI